MGLSCVREDEEWVYDLCPSQINKVVGHSLGARMGEVTVSGARRPGKVKLRTKLGSLRPQPSLYG